jgi:hypothetical protein
MRALLLVATLLLSGCTGPADESSDDPASVPSTQASGPTTGTPPLSEQPDREPVRFQADRAMRDVRLFAGRIGPRPATSPAYAEAARIVADRFRKLGYGVARQRFPVPAGDSWGTPVAAGFSSNVIAHPPGFDPAEPHLVIGAHLDTVAVAPGGEDNASGVSVLLELARLSSVEPPRLPTVFVAFGAEEPVGPGDELHHFGSRHYVAEMRPGQGPALRGMVSLDRVGVGSRVPVCIGPLTSPRVQLRLLRGARALGIPAVPCDNTASDHWSFEKAGHAVARLGSTPYAAYHSASDVPAVVNPAQLRRVGRVAWAWLRTG